MNDLSGILVEFFAERLHQNLRRRILGGTPDLKRSTRISQEDFLVEPLLATIHQSLTGRILSGTPPEALHRHLTEIREFRQKACPSVPCPLRMCYTCYTTPRPSRAFPIWKSGKEKHNGLIR
jgi:hypothetical protein